MKYEIDACHACSKKHNNINSLNNCLVETEAAFSNTLSTNYLRSTNSAAKWNDCIVKKMTEMGRAPCNFQLNMAPVFAGDTHPFPDRLDELKDKDKALEKALEDCKKSRYPNECKNNCHIDYDAVVYVSHVPDEGLLSAPLARGTYQCVTEPYEEPRKEPPLQTSLPLSPDFTLENIAKDKPVIFWIFFTISGIILSFVIVAFLYILISKKNNE